MILSYIFLPTDPHALPDNRKAGGSLPYEEGSAMSRCWSLVILTFGLCAAAHASESETEKPPREMVEKQVEGWTLVVDPDLFTDEHRELGERALGAVANHLQRVRFILPDEKVAELQKLRLWLDREHPSLTSMQYHPSRGWLVAHGHDPRLEKHVHLPRAKDLLDRRTWAKHPYCILHELAHAYHDQVLGFDHPAVEAAYKNIKENGTYESVRLYTGAKVRHYALTNAKEYFAESTEAYLGVNDFYPFVRAELQDHDPTMYELLTKIWGPLPPP